MNSSSKNIADIRQEYALASLQKSDLAVNPIIQFQSWFQEAVHAQINDVNAMTLATVDSFNKPHARIVLLKGVEHNNFTFFTNYHSHKGFEIDQNANVSLVFYWKELQRQVRIEGVASKLSVAASTEYFISRPKQSQLGAWASNQSEILADRALLEQRFIELEKQYEHTDVPKPPHWGGYAVNPSMIEFWQGRESRLHDRFRYLLQQNESWDLQRLNP